MGRKHYSLFAKQGKMTNWTLKSMLHQGSLSFNKISTHFWKYVIHGPHSEKAYQQICLCSSLFINMGCLYGFTFYLFLWIFQFCTLPRVYNKFEWINMGDVTIFFQHFHIPWLDYCFLPDCLSGVDLCLSECRLLYFHFFPRVPPPPFEWSVM